MKGRSIHRWRNGMCQGDYANNVRLILPTMIVILFVYIATLLFILCLMRVITSIRWRLLLDIKECIGIIFLTNILSAIHVTT